MIRARSTLMRLYTAGFACVGVVAGHALGYAIAVPQSQRRERLLHATGHTNWRTLVVVALIVGAASSAGIVARSFRRGGVAVIPSRIALWGRLAILQILMLSMLEVIERLSDHQTTWGISGRLLIVGAVVQVVVAGALAAALRFIARAALAVARRLRRYAPRRLRAALPPPALRIRGLRKELLRAFFCGLRGPPRAAFTH